MPLTKPSAIVALLGLVTKITAHGIVQGIVADGVWYQGYKPSFQFQQTPPVVAGWSVPEDIDTGFVTDVTSPDIICHKAATPGGAYVKVQAGNPIELQWTIWPESHHGPMLDYLANCDGDCTTVDKTKLEWVKIDEVGLIDGSKPPGFWGDDQMIANNNSWVVVIPSTIAPGKYVLRHETIALHSAGTINNNQNYPQCVNLEITGSGNDDLPSGTVGTQLYKQADPGLVINIYTTLTTYTIPGPTLYSAASSISQTLLPFSGSAPATGSPVPTSSVPPTKPTVATGFSNSTTHAGGKKPVAPTGIKTTVETDKPTGHPSHASAASTSTSTSEQDHDEPSAVGDMSQPVPTNTESATSSAAVDAGWSNSNTNTVSFTSTVTGRIGKPTKFTCYAEL